MYCTVEQQKRPARDCRLSVHKQVMWRSTNVFSSLSLQGENLHTALQTFEMCVTKLEYRITTRQSFQTVHSLLQIIVCLFTREVAMAAMSASG